MEIEKSMDLGKQSHPGMGQPVGFSCFYGIYGSHRLEKLGWGKLSLPVGNRRSFNIPKTILELCKKREKLGETHSAPAAFQGLWWWLLFLGALEFQDFPAGSRILGPRHCADKNQC